MDNELKPQPHVDENDDIDTKGHLAFALFTGGIIVLLIIIYALALAA